MTKEFNPENPKISANIGCNRRIWIHERAEIMGLTDTQYLCRIIDIAKGAVEKNGR